MIKRVLCCCLVALLALCLPAYAQSLPLVTDGVGQAVSFSAVETDTVAPDAGEWNLYVDAAVGIDEAQLELFRAWIAVKATEMEFNSYISMSYAEKASVVVAFFSDAAFEDDAFYGEGDSAASNAVIPVCVAPSGDFAVFSLIDGAWVNVGMFALNGDAATEPATYHLDLSCYELGDGPTYVAHFDDAAGAWQVVGLNQAYVDATIVRVF